MRSNRGRWASEGLCRGIVLLALGIGMLGAASRTDSFKAVKAQNPPAAGATLSDAAWQEALKADRFINLTQRSNAPLPTTAYILYDDNYLYIAFDCSQRGIPITASQNIDNASVGRDDHVTVWIDASGNGARVYSFSATPRGVHDETSNENARYTPPWNSAATISNGNYVVTMQIPLSDLRSQSDARQDWRINFERYVAASNDDYTWAYDRDQTSVSDPQYWPRLTDIRVNERATRPRPYADVFGLESYGSQRSVFQNGVGQFQSMSPRVAGVDVTYPFTNTLALVGTLSPDFSNVEADQTTIAPQEFRRSYQEYRPFFAQGAQYINALPQIGFFGAGDSMFYTPPVGVFDRGLKAEGTSGRNTLGLLSVAGPGLGDSAAGYSYTLPDNSFTASAETVLVHHPGVSDATTGIALGHRNLRSGLVGHVLFNSENHKLTGSTGAQSFSAAEIFKNQHFYVEGLYHDIGPAYAPVDGYTAINDIRGPGVNIETRGVGQGGSPVQSYALGVYADRFVDRSGAVHQADAGAYLGIGFKNLFSIDTGAGPSELRVYQQGYPAYTGAQTLWFNTRSVALAYKKNTPSPLNVSYAWGPFGGIYTQQIGANTSRTFGTFGVSLEYDGNIERQNAGAPSFDTQWLRRVALSRSFGRGASLAFAVRSINGTGGFALPGGNLSILFQQRFASQDLLYLEYGTPAAEQTLHRFILKYVFHTGGAAGS